MSASVIILSKDRPDLLRSMQQTIQNYLNNFEVILMNNGTDDETHDLAREFGWLDLSLGYNTSFSHGVNTAAKYATQDRLLLLNNDAVPDQALLDEHARAHDPILGSLIIDRLAKVNHAGVAFAEGGMPVHVGRGDKVVDWYGKGNKKWPAVTFACVSIDKELFNDMDGLDTNYVYGYEDTDFCARVVEEHRVLPQVTYKATAVHEEFGTRKPGDDTDNALRFWGTWIVTGRYRKALEEIVV